MKYRKEREGLAYRRTESRGEKRGGEGVGVGVSRKRKYTIFYFIRSNNSFSRDFFECMEKEIKPEMIKIGKCGAS